VARAALRRLRDTATATLAELGDEEAQAEIDEANATECRRCGEIEPVGERGLCKACEAHMRRATGGAL
jgi:hypothetical protein